jgi:uncharacterized protein
VRRVRLEAQAAQALRRFPAVVLYGSRQVGKTTLARTIAATHPAVVHVDLELPSGLAKLSDPETFFRAHAGDLVVLDEVQHVPGLFAALRGVIDADRRPGRFLLLGSASPALLRQSAESLTGRAAYVEVPPLGLHDGVATRDAVDVPTLWTRGGYPPSLLAADDEDAYAWREEYVRSTIERDLPRLDVRVPPLQIRRFWTMLAHWHGHVWNGSKIAQSLDVTGPTARRWLDVLIEACLVRAVTPLHANLKKRLVKSPKVYVRDSGLLHALLGLRDTDAVLGHPAAGASFEGLVVEQVASSLSGEVDIAFFGTHAGAEIDLVLTWPDGTRVAVEAKLSSAPRLPRAMHAAMDDVGCERGFVVTPATDRFPLSDRVEAVSIADFVRDVLPGLSAPR